MIKLLITMIQNLYIIMNLNLNINNREYKEEPVKSTRKETPENHNTSKQNKQVENNQYKNFIRAYRKEVQLPINFQTSIYVSKTSQRCIQHNHVITLYCINDKRPLCIHCIYPIIAHKNHEVIPLNKANQVLKAELSLLIKNINTNIFPIMSHLIQKNKQNLQILQNQMQDFSLKINKFYNQITLDLINTKNEYLSSFLHLNQQLKNHYSQFAQEITKIKQYTLQKLKDLQEKNGEECLLFHHNVAMHLSKLGMILSPEFCSFKNDLQGEIGNKLDQLWGRIKNIFRNQGVGVEISYQKSSLSPSRNNNRTWNPQKKQIYDPKNSSLSKIRSNPKLFSAFTPRQNDIFKKKQTGHNFFSKTKLERYSQIKPKENLQRQSQTNRLITTQK